MPAINKWSRKFDACVQCGQSDRKHFGDGLCRRCYLEKYNAANASTVQAMRRRWYDKAGGKEWSRIQREQRHYDGKREIILKRDGYRCQSCATDRLLCVHHKDGNGRGKPSPNNNLDNLVTLCRKCHIKAHREELVAARIARYAAKRKLKEQKS